MELITETQVLEKLKRGDMAALGWFYEQYRVGFVRSLVRKFSCNPDEAESLFHEVLLEFDQQVRDEKITTVKGKGLGGWFYQTGINKYKEEHRRQIKAANFRWENPFSDYEEKEAFFEMLEKGLKELKEDCFDMLTQYYVEGISLEHLQVSLNFPSYKAAKTKLYRCREKLKKIIFNTPKN